MSKFLIKNIFQITKFQEAQLQKYIDELSLYNKSTNLVGKSTLADPWRLHILDSIQIAPLIKNKNSSILDLGSGAGLPGLILAIVGFKNVNLIDSNNKKIKFLNHIIDRLDIKANTFLCRIESFKKNKYDFLISRALANLDKLLTYSHYFLKKDTVLIFLKGKTVNEEIAEAIKDEVA